MFCRRVQERRRVVSQRAVAAARVCRIAATKPRSYKNVAPTQARSECPSLRAKKRRTKCTTLRTQVAHKRSEAAQARERERARTTQDTQPSQTAQPSTPRAKTKRHKNNQKQACRHHVDIQSITATLSKTHSKQNTLQAKHAPSKTRINPSEVRMTK